jgi:hypothetical protein
MSSFWELMKDLKCDHMRELLRDKRNHFFDLLSRGYDSRGIVGGVIIRDEDLPRVLFECCERMTQRHCEVSEEERSLAQHVLKELKKRYPYDNYASIY